MWGRYSKSLVDKTGPGSYAWEQADLAIDNFRDGKKNAAFCALYRMARELRKHGFTDSEIEAWKDEIAKDVRPPQPVLR